MGQRIPGRASAGLISTVAAHATYGGYYFCLRARAQGSSGEVYYSYSYLPATEMLAENSKPELPVLSTSLHVSHPTFCTFLISVGQIRLIIYIYSKH